MIINICGKIGSGKSTIGEYIASKFKFKFINVDSLNKFIYKEDQFINIVRNYAPNALDNENKINKSILREKIFENDDFNLEILDFSSKWVNNWLIRNLKDDVNYLIESFTTSIFEKINVDCFLFIISDKEKHLLRTDQRDHRLVYETNKILIFQEKLLDEELKKLITKNEKIIFIYNNDSLESLEKHVNEEMDKLLNKS